MLKQGGPNAYYEASFERRPFVMNQGAELNPLTGQAVCNVAAAVLSTARAELVEAAAEAMPGQGRHVVAAVARTSKKRGPPPLSPVLLYCYIAGSSDRAGVGTPFSILMP